MDLLLELVTLVRIIVDEVLCKPGTAKLILDQKKADHFLIYLSYDNMNIFTFALTQGGRRECHQRKIKEGGKCRTFSLLREILLLDVHAFDEPKCTFERLHRH